MRLNKATGKMRPAHDGSVEEVCIAAMNSLVVSVSQDETIRTWKMNNCSMQREIRVGLGLAGAVLHPHASLVGANCADFAIRFSRWIAEYVCFPPLFLDVMCPTSREQNISVPL